MIDAVVPRPVPDAPATADLYSLSGESLRLNWTAPLSDGGAAVQSYRVRRHPYNIYKHTALSTYTLAPSAI